MQKLMDIYKCSACGNTVALLDAQKGELKCCGKTMELLANNSIEASKEKHIPVVEAIENGYKVVVGSVKHPMTAEHYIKWIELLLEDGTTMIKMLEVGEEPEAVFNTSLKVVKARAYCNLHGLWIQE